MRQLISEYIHLIGKGCQMAIAVNLSRSWPKVQAGEEDAQERTLGSWAQITNKDLEAHADVILGVYRNEVVTAYDIESWTRDETNGRVTFKGKPSEKWAHLIHTPNPGKPWG